jgi:hypothetical protein
MWSRPPRRGRTGRSRCRRGNPAGRVGRGQLTGQDGRRDLAIGLGRISWTSFAHRWPTGSSSASSTVTRSPGHQVTSSEFDTLPGGAVSLSEDGRKRLTASPDVTTVTTARALIPAGRIAAPRAHRGAGPAAPAGAAGLRQCGRGIPDPGPPHRHAVRRAVGLDDRDPAGRSQRIYLGSSNIRIHRRRQADRRPRVAGRRPAVLDSHRLVRQSALTRNGSPRYKRALSRSRSAAALRYVNALSGLVIGVRIVFRRARDINAATSCQPSVGIRLGARYPPSSLACFRACLRRSQAQTPLSLPLFDFVSHTECLFGCMYTTQNPHHRKPSRRWARDNRRSVRSRNFGFHSLRSAGGVDL